MKRLAESGLGFPGRFFLRAISSRICFFICGMLKWARGKIGNRGNKFIKNKGIWVWKKKIGYMI